MNMLVGKCLYLDLTEEEYISKDADIDALGVVPRLVQSDFSPHSMIS